MPPIGEMSSSRRVAPVEGGVALVPGWIRIVNYSGGMEAVVKFATKGEALGEVDPMEAPVTLHEELEQVPHWAASLTYTRSCFV